MAFDDLAAAVVGLDLNDPKELFRLRTMLEKIQADARQPGQIRQLAAEAAQVIIRAQDKPAQAGEALDRLDKIISRMQSAPEPAAAQSVETPAAATVSGSSSMPAQPEAAGPQPEESEPLFETDPEILKEFISESLDRLQTAEGALLKLESDPQDPESLNTVFRAFHSTKGTASFLGLSEIKDLAHEAEQLLELARQGAIQLKNQYADLALECEDTLANMIRWLSENREAKHTALPENYADLLHRLRDLRADDRGQPKPAAVPAAAEPVAAPAAQKMTSASGEAPAVAANGKAHNEGLATGTVRVSTIKLDALINMVGELVITQAMIAQNEDYKTERFRGTRSILQLEKITRELQDLTMSLRMVPLFATFQKMERLVRDLARKSQKSIHFQIEGEDTEIDRNMVEVLNDPLVHMLQNAVDHGIEPPDRRRAAGKPETGTIILKAYHQAGNVVITVSDDGHGLNQKKILERAAERGLLAEDRELTENEIYKLIFLPGFSTAEQVSDISGRGVGLDVVKKNIESLRGRIETGTVPGQETVFTIRIPLTLAIIDGMLLKVSDQHYILPTLNVQKAFRPEQSWIFLVQGRGEMVKIRERLLPVFRLHRLFRQTGAIEDPTQGLLLIVENEGEACALLVDSLLGQQQVVIKSLPEGLKGAKGVSGAAILGDGRIGLILDVGSILQLAHGRE